MLESNSSTASKHSTFNAKQGLKFAMATVATVVNGNTYTIDPRYDLNESKILGKGSFGVVCSAFDTVREVTLAIKRIRPYANDEWDAKHTLREVRLMRLLGQHPNVRFSLTQLKRYPYPDARDTSSSLLTSGDYALRAESVPT